MNDLASCSQIPTPVSMLLGLVCADTNVLARFILLVLASWSHMAHPLSLNLYPLSITPSPSNALTPLHPPLVTTHLHIMAHYDY